MYLVASTEAEKRLEIKANKREDIEEIFNKIISMNQKSPKKVDLLGKKKVASKPKVRYFRITIGEENL